MCNCILCAHDSVVAVIQSNGCFTRGSIEARQGIELPDILWVPAFWPVQSKDEVYGSRKCGTPPPRLAYLPTLLSFMSNQENSHPRIPGFLEREHCLKDFSRAVFFVADQVCELREGINHQNPSLHCFCFLDRSIDRLRPNREFRVFSAL